MSNKKGYTWNKDGKNCNINKKIIGVGCDENVELNVKSFYHVQRNPNDMIN